MKNTHLGVAVIILLFGMSCQENEVVPNEINEAEALHQKIMGKWNFLSMEVEKCQISTSECSLSGQSEMHPNDYFEFTIDSLIFQFAGNRESFGIGVAFPDTLRAKGHTFSEVFIIKEIDSQSMTLTYYLGADNGNDYTDYYYLTRP